MAIFYLDHTQETSNYILTGIIFKATCKIAHISFANTLNCFQIISKWTPRKRRKKENWYYWSL